MARRLLSQDRPGGTEPTPSPVADRVAKTLLSGLLAAMLLVLGWSLLRGAAPATLVVLGGLVALLAGGFLLPSPLRINLVLLAIATLVPVYGAEIVLFRLAHPKPPEGDQRSKLEVVEDLRAAGVDAWPSIHPGRFLSSDGLSTRAGHLLPLGGISRRTTVFCNESGRWMVYDADEHGFHNPAGRHRIGRVDAVLVGDSFTHGACVQPGEEVAARLRAEGIDSLSLGIGADGPLLELATLREFARPLAPSVALWMYFEANDLSDLAGESRSPTLHRYLEDPAFSQDLVDHQQAVDEALMAHAESGLRTALRDDALRVLRLKQLGARLRPLVSRRTPPPLALLGEVLAAAKRDVEGWGGRLLFVYLPALDRFLSADPGDGDLFERGAVLGLARDLDLPVIDFVERLRQHEDPVSLFPFRRFPHLNAEGYALLADELRERLVAEGGGP